MYSKIANTRSGPWEHRGWVHGKMLLDFIRNCLTICKVSTKFSFLPPLKGGSCLFTPLQVFGIVLVGDFVRSKSYATISGFCFLVFFFCSSPTAITVQISSYIYFLSLCLWGSVFLSTFVCLLSHFDTDNFQEIFIYFGYQFWIRNVLANLFSESMVSIFILSIFLCRKN